MTFAARFRSIATPASASGGAGKATRSQRPTSIVAWALLNLLLLSVPTVAAAATILLSPAGPIAPTHLLALSAAVAVAFAFCTAAWVGSPSGGRPVFRLIVHASLAALSSWIAWQYLAWSLALATTDLQVAIAELPDRFRQVVQLLRERYGVLPALVPVIAAWVCLSAAILAAALIVDLRKRRAETAARPFWARWAAETWSWASDTAEPLWTARAAGAALRWALITCPAAAGGAYFLLGPHPHDAKLQTMLISGGLSVVCWVVLVKPRGREWRLFLLGVHAGAAAIAGEIFSSYLSWWLTQLPENPLRAAWGFPRLLSGHVDWLQARYGGLAGLSPFTSAAFSVLSACFAVDQAVRLLKGFGETEAGRPRAKSRLYGSARFMPNHHMRRLSRDPGGVILGAESRSPKSRLVSYPLAGHALTVAPPRSGKTATVALNLLRPGGAGFGGSTIVGLAPTRKTRLLRAHRVLQSTSLPP